MATDRSGWPLPSESPRVRVLLYLAEGMVVGAATTEILLVFFGSFLIDFETGSFNPRIPGVSVFFLLVFVFFLLRGIAFIDIGRRYARDVPPEYQDWKATRRWSLVLAVGLVVGGGLLGVSVLLWGWWEVVYSQRARLILTVTTLVGFTLNLYIHYRLGVKII